MHFLEWKALYFDSNFTGFCSWGYNSISPTLYSITRPQWVDVKLQTSQLPSARICSKLLPSSTAISNFWPNLQLMMNSLGVSCQFCFDIYVFWHGLTLIPAWISNGIVYNVWDKITYLFPNFNSCTIEVWERISNYIPHFAGYVITYPCCD